MSWEQQRNDDYYNQPGSGGMNDPYGSNPTAAAGGGGYYNPNNFQANQAGYGMNDYSNQVGGGGGYPPATDAYGQPHMQPGQAGGGGGGYPAPGQQQYMIPGAGMLQDPMVTNLAMSYGRDFVGKGQEEIKKNLDKYVSIGQLKYYFAVDTAYVRKKLALLVFPFLQKDWSIRYSHDEPVQPRYEANAADLYIPSMAFVTYILVVGYMLGMQSRFSPEMLATTASSALTALFLEILVVYLTTTLMAVTSTLAKWDYLAFSMYKYVGMIVCLVAGGLMLSRTVYYAALLYSAAALALFLFRTLHPRVEPEVHGMVESHGKRKIWLIMVMVAWQPVMMWWLTYSLVPSAVEAGSSLPTLSQDDGMK